MTAIHLKGIDEAPEGRSRIEKMLSSRTHHWNMIEKAEQAKDAAMSEFEGQSKFTLPGIEARIGPDGELVVKANTHSIGDAELLIDWLRGWYDRP